MPGCVILFRSYFLDMNDKRQPESAKEKSPKQKDANAAKPGSSGVEEARQKAPRKSGPSVIIAPGPGSDVVATPPRRI